ncbi:MAG TPA: TIGR02594 family protein, partial [Hyphomicrobium sp.]|nr:TIGR02594 family protein [Hyphomicrobium sp.]
MMEQPPWLAAAWAELGQREVRGSADNARIRAFFRDVGHPATLHDEVAWCAAFAGACLERAGFASTRSLMARSYLRWGEEIEAGRFGAVAVLSRGADPAAGHVGFLLGETASHVMLLGGNQGDAVSVAAYPKTRLIGLRWPQAVTQRTAASPEQTGSAPAIFAEALAHVLEMEGGYTD